MLKRARRLGRLFGDVLPDDDGQIRLRVGDDGPEVEDWQRNLKAFGIALQVTGQFDSATANATLAFKAMFGLGGAAVVDDATRQVMANELDKLEPGKTGSNQVITGPDVEISGRGSLFGWLLGIPLLALLFKSRR